MILRYLGYIFIYAIVVVTMLIDYPLKPDAFGYGTAALILLSPAVIYLLAARRAQFWVTIRNTYVVASWLSISLLLYLLTKYGILTGMLGSLIYIVFILVAVGAIGLLNLDKGKYILLQNEPVEPESFIRGITYGFLSFIFAMLALRAALATIDYRMLYIGPVTSQLAELDIGVEFLLALFLVSIPEELMARVYYFKFGSAVLDPLTAAVLTSVTGYAFHAVTRYGLEYASLVLFILTAVWVVLAVAYIRHGLLASIAAHTVYNTLIAALEYGYIPFAASVVIFSIPLIYLMTKRKTIF